MQWWVLQDRDTAEPWALCVLDDHQCVRRYVPGRGLVDFPPDADEIIWAEPGGRQVGPEEWMRLLRSGHDGVRLQHEVLAQLQGGAPDLPVPYPEEPHSEAESLASSDQRQDIMETATRDTPKRYVGFSSGELTPQEMRDLADQLFDAINADRERAGPDDGHRAR